jgi:hypothetical protein
MSEMKPSNLSAQLSYRARGNPPNSLPVTAISNCFPGLEFDFRNIWRRILVGIVIVENNNYVIEAEDPAFNDLKGHRLLRIDGNDVVTRAFGPISPRGGSRDLATSQSNPVAFMEWSNTIAKILKKQGQKVRCEFTKEKSDPEVLLPTDPKELLVREMELRRIFEHGTVEGKETAQAVLAAELLKPGELSQGLCSPWQNDYRECACYYWAASRPDYINVVAAADGASQGDNWMQKERGGQYVLDDRSDSRLITYDDLFTSWETMLQFQIGGKDAPEEIERRSGVARKK